MYTADKSNYLNPSINFIFGVTIYEYDMQQAGFSILKEFKMFGKDKITELNRLSKNDCNVAIGKLRRDNKEFSTEFGKRFIEMRQRFIAGNNLTDNDIISVKNDAFFVMKSCRETDFGQVKFAIKNQYSSYIRFPDNHNIECYYNNTGIDFKGLNSIAENTHRLCTVDFLIQFFRLMESRDRSVKRILINFIDQYKRHALEESYYLEFNSKSSQLNPYYNYSKVLIPLVQMVQTEGL